MAYSSLIVPTIRTCKNIHSLATEQPPMHLTKVLSIFIGLLLGSSVLAETTVSITPGKWQVTTTLSMSMMPQSRVETVTECVKEDVFSAENMLQDDQSCTFVERSVSGNTLSWTMECATDAGPATGKGQFTSHGKSADGTMEMTMTAQGQTFTTKMIWQGKHIGACS